MILDRKLIKLLLGFKSVMTKSQSICESVTIVSLNWLVKKFMSKVSPPRNLELLTGVWQFPPSPTQENLAVALKLPLSTIE